MNIYDIVAQNPCAATEQANEWQHLAPGGSIPVARRDHSAVWSPEADGMYLFAGSNFHGRDLKIPMCCRMVYQG